MSDTVRLMVMSSLLLIASESLAATRQLQDPTMPALVPSSPDAVAVDDDLAPEALRLSLILLDPARRVAVIDGQQVQEGSKVGSHRVLKIESDKVLLDSGKTLFLFGPSVIGPAE